QNGLDEIDADKYRETLIKTLKEKARKVKKKNKFEKMGQIIRFAQNRGFEPEMIHRYLSEVVE
ncbi:MAG TPA: RecX family transcriptional regulator, partial [Mariniphaga anaerophila]|nr:RecX family transcriptional regulator [Mariniphaga anaerophila]